MVIIQGYRDELKVEKVTIQFLGGGLCEVALRYNIVSDSAISN